MWPCRKFRNEADAHRIFQNVMCYAFKRPAWTLRLPQHVIVTLKLEFRVRRKTQIPLPPEHPNRGPLICVQANPHEQKVRVIGHEAVDGADG